MIDDEDTRVSRMRRQSDAIKHLRESVERMGRELVAIHGIDGGNGKLGNLRETVDDIKRDLREGFAGISVRMDRQDAGARATSRWLISQFVVVALAVFGYLAKGL